MQEIICKSKIILAKIKCLFINYSILCRDTCVLRSALALILCSSCLFLFFCGCSAFVPPTDYYEKTIAMESGQKRSETGSTNENKPENTETIKIIRRGSDETPIVDVLPKLPQEKSIKEPRQEENDFNTQDKTSDMSSASLPNTFFPAQDSETSTENISISSDVIKSALEIAGINVRSVELVNRRIGGGKNSVRVSFICESANVVNEKFFTMCAVIYHLNKSSKTVDIVVGIAEDPQSNLLGALQSNTEDITAWMDNKITRAEWFSRISRKML